MQRSDEFATLPLEAVGQHDTEVEALGRQLLDELIVELNDELNDELNSELRRALGDVAGLHAPLWLLEPERQRESDGVEHAVGIDGDHPIGKSMDVAEDVADVLARSIVGGLALPNRWSCLSCLSCGPRSRQDRG
jgi:hypothetical protein